MLRPLGFPAGLGLVLLAACGGGIRTLGPTPPDEGIVLYLHAEFAGPSQSMNVDVSDLSRVEGPCTGRAEGEDPTWDDCVSSIRVRSGWSATLYEDDDFEGRSVTLTADSLNLRNLRGPCDGSFNDCVSSIKVTRP